MGSGSNDGAPEFQNNRFCVSLFSPQMMLSATKRIASSTLSGRNFTGTARGMVLKGFIRCYIPGRNWTIAGGISFQNGIAKVPESCGSVYSSRKTKCGVIVLNRPKVDHVSAFPYCVVW